MARSSKSSIFIVIVLFIIVSIITCLPFEITEELSRKVVDQCVDKCLSQNRTDDNGNEYITKIKNSTTPNILSHSPTALLNTLRNRHYQKHVFCMHGCGLWSNALQTSCESVCNDTTDVLSPRFYCVIGCNEAFNNYVQKLKEIIKTPPAPALVADSLTATSLSLEWEGFKYPNLSYLVQWHYEELSGSWQYCRNQTWGENTTIHVDNLQPYTKYRFRIAILPSIHHTDPIVSTPSVVISTSPAGVPSSAPVELRVTAVDSHRISLSWEPGPFPNGPILAYVLRIAETIPNGYSALKDLPVSDKNPFYMFQNLSPSTTYKVSVSMRNPVGEGPEAIVNVTTPSSPKAVTSQQPILILGGRHTILQQAGGMFVGPKVLYNTSHHIQGVGIDVDMDLLFVSDSSGSIHKMNLFNNSGPPTTIFTSASNPYKPLDLSVDWLNKHLYILGEVRHNVTKWLIFRCDYDGRSQTIAVAGFQSKPVHIEVDPYNGYLFWVIRGYGSGGLYRLDLADISNGVKHEVIPNQILKDPNLGAFTIDHTNFTILVPHQTNNTILSVSLDGREIIDIRKNTLSPMFRPVQSLSFANGSFYWTNGTVILAEEFHDNTFYQNSFPYEIEKNFNNILVALPASQPIPVAVNPPIGLQSVMGTNHAKITWQPPHLLGHQGIGAWQQWRYHLQITDFENNATIHRPNIERMTSYTVNDLKENTVYVIKAAAVTSSGTGPWSSEFIGKTLSSTENGVYSSMLWSTYEGLLKSDLSGDNIETIIHRSDLENRHIIDITWYKNLIYYVTNDSSAWRFDVQTNTRTELVGMGNVESLVVDWIGKKIYWSSRKLQLIHRGNLDGSNRDSRPIVAVVKELKIDSIKGYLYWNTGHAIECSRLNGENKITYYPPQFRDQDYFMIPVKGLTIDLHGKLLYWIIHGYDGSSLYKAPTADVITDNNQITGELISPLSNSLALGPLCYFSDRLIWLQDDTHAIISDVTGHNKAKLNSISMVKVNTITVIDPNLYNSLIDLENINVIPDQINHTSIEIKGNYKIFNISWAPISEINYTTVFYEIKIEHNKKTIYELTTNESFIHYSKEDLPAYSEIDVSIRSYTYWGSAPTIRTTLHSPQAPPSKPLRPRLFIIHQNNPIRNENTNMVVFRWNKPKYANGEIKGYQIHCWCKDDFVEKTECFGVKVDPHHLHYYLKNATKNATYFFQVRAFTDAGSGPVTETVNKTTDIAVPIPKLAIAYHDSIKFFDLDLEERILYNFSMMRKPIDFTVNLRESLVYWLNDFQEIFYSKIYDTVHTRLLLTINGTGVGICVDWISRMLYWSQQESLPDQHLFTIYQLDLNVYESEGIHKVSKILQRGNHIQRLQIAPMRKSLYWIEMVHHDVGKLMTAYNNGTQIRLFFHDYHDTNTISRSSQNTKSECNCPENPSVGKSLAIDYIKPDDYRIYWNDLDRGHIFVSDVKGCNCDVVVNSTNFSNGISPHHITFNNRYLFWSNSSKSSLYYIEKNVDNGEIYNYNIPTGHKIFALGNNIQPYPPHKCLIPKQIPMTPNLISRSSHSLILSLPEPVKDDDCDRYDIATPIYTINYRAHGADNNGTYKTTFNKILHLDKLRPLSKYVFTVQINNYYGKLMNITPMEGPPVIFQTYAEAPAPVKNLNAFVFSPNFAMIEWQISEVKENSDNVDNDIWYEIHWKTEESLSNERVKSYNKFFPRSNSSDLEMPHVYLSNLFPSQDYRIWIQTHSNNSENHTDSESVLIKTYREPNDIVLVHSKPNEIRISWIPYETSQITSEYYVEYSNIVTDQWKVVEDDEVKTFNNSVEFTAKNLSPKTLYKFRLKIMFTNNTKPYYWPPDNKFSFETPGDRPSPPGKPIINKHSNSVYQLQWEPSIPHGSPILMYRLYGRISLPNDAKIRIQRHTKRFTRGANDTQFQSDVPYSSIKENAESLVSDPENKDISDDWVMFYNGTNSHWIVPEAKLKDRYVFLVQSQNAYGRSDFSEISDEFDFSQTNKLSTDTVAIILGVTFPTILVAIVIICIGCFKRKTKEIPGKPLSLNGTLRGPDVELANLRELPRSRGGLFQHSTNILYNNGFCSPPTDAEIALLPHIRRDQISLTKFLGSGAFGEVFEGKAKDLDFDGSETRVAIKTLREGATDQEKTEFLQEAQLMSNFKHEHILRMLGVCLDNDPHFIIMELMEGGDLLSYLRARRPMLYTNESLTLHDLLSMCLDVTKGCRYLEEMHFVHRDLACRNCLVSQQATGRIVKIGDFGLARDIYKNDYYRKEGEGLLPVRWMAVECLTDGVFSRASDVWAWAVLCWEVITLGQQPYSALPNHAVMRYVRGGGILQRPANCPASLFQLLQKCWSYNPDQRPAFKYCLEILEELMQNVDENTPLTTNIEEEPQYITVVSDANGITNRIYFMDENQNDENSGHFNIEDHKDIQIVPIPIQADVVNQTPKYLELLYDSDTPVSCDGYEVPRSSIRSNASRRTTESENNLDGDDDTRIVNNKLHSTQSLPIDKTYRVKVLETFNGCARPPNITFGADNETNSLRKLIPNRNSFTGVIRQNSIVSHKSDDEKLSQNNHIEANKLLNGFVKRNSKVNIGCNFESTSRTAC